MRIELEDLPKLQELFQTLVSGYHLSYEDFGLYHELQEKESPYDALFSALGYSLKADQRGFYYLVPEANPQLVLNATTQKMALLIFVLAEMLADEGRDPLTTITRGDFDVREISCRMFERSTDVLEEGGLDSAEAVEKCFLTSFRRLGFATVNGDVLRFRPPVSRFLDICLELGREKIEIGEESPETANAE